MRVLTFDPFRTLGCPGLTYVKPACLARSLELVRAADWLLFPDYADVNLLVHGLGKRIFPSLASYQLGFDKVEMTRAFQCRFPANVPHTVIVGNTPAERERVLDEWILPFVAKLPRAAGGAGVYLVESAEQWREYCEMTSVLYVQELLPIDRDVRVVIVGERVVHAYWRVAPPGLFHNNVARGGLIELHDVPEAAMGLALDAARTLGIDHAGFDVAMVGERPYLLEFNRLFGLEALNAIGIRTGALIHDLLMQRQGTTPSHAAGSMQVTIPPELAGLH